VMIGDENLVLDDLAWWQRINIILSYGIFECGGGV
jgi:hypothetical protein